MAAAGPSSSAWNWLRRGAGGVRLPRLGRLRRAGRAEGRRPVACVLAGGVNVPYPVQNRFLYDDVAAAGVLVSEYPPGSPHDWRNFPRRNRILSGLCLGVLAVECRPFGGTMSTVNHAVEQDRDVFAVPGALDAP